MLEVITVNNKCDRLPLNTLKIIAVRGVRLGFQFLKISKGQLIDKCQSQPSMLEHVIEREVLNQIVSAVNMVVTVLESRLDDEGRWIARLGSRRMVRARVAALGLNVWNIAVLMRVSEQQPQHSQ